MPLQSSFFGSEVGHGGSGWLGGLVKHRSGGDYTLVFPGFISIFPAPQPLPSAMTTPWTSLPTAPAVLTADPSRTTAVMPLPGLAILALSGPDSMKFLQGQTTTDFRDVEQGRVLPGAVCSLKGRVLFSFTAIPDGENVLLVLPDDQLDAALIHLKKYAAFSKTQLTDARGKTALAGIEGTVAEKKVAALFGNAPAAGRCVKNAAGAWAARVGTTPRFLLGLPAETLADTWHRLQQDAVVADAQAWRAADIRDGIASVFAASRDLFQPQELNYPAIGGVSYNKGCYTGQEVVARLHFRGKLKQRLYRLAASATEVPATGQAIHAGPAHAGDVVMAAMAGENRVELLGIVKNAVVAAGGLTLGETGSSLEVLDLPYSLPPEKEE